MWKQLWEQLWEYYRGTTIGIVCGFLLGIVYLFWGFWDMLVFTFIFGVCVYIGRKADQQEHVLWDLAQTYRRLTDRWRMFR